MTHPRQPVLTCIRGLAALAVLAAVVLLLHPTVSTLLRLRPEFWWNAFTRSIFNTTLRVQLPWIITLVIVALTLWLLQHPLARLITGKGGCVCPECGYSLRNLKSPRCPECGWEIPKSPHA
jgi:hypothetical protein